MVPVRLVLVLVCGGPNGLKSINNCSDGPWKELRPRCGYVARFGCEPMFLSDGIVAYSFVFLEFRHTERRLMALCS